MLSASTSNFFLYLLREFVSKLSKEYNVLICCPTSDILQEFCEREGAKHITLDIARKPRLVKDIATLVLAQRIVYKYEPDLIMTFNPKPGFVFACIKKINSNVRFVHNFTGLIFPYRKGIVRTILLGMDKFVLKASTTSVAESMGVLEQLKRATGEFQSIKVIGYGNISGIDPGKFYFPDLKKRMELRQTYGFSRSSIICLFVGRINRDKGIVDLVRAFKSVQNHNIDMKLVVLGAYDDNQSYNELFDFEIKNNSAITYLGRRNDVNFLMQASDLLISPTLREGFSNTILEAQACGLPVIANDVPGVYETVSKTGLGYIIKSNSEMDIKNGLNDFVINLKHITDKQKSVCAEYIKNKYNKNDVSNNYVRFVNEVISK